MRIDLDLGEFFWLTLRRFSAVDSAGQGIDAKVDDGSSDGTDASVAPDATGTVEAPRDTVEGSFRSPATRNAFRRFSERVLDGLDGEARTEMERAVEEVRLQAEALAAGDEGPYGHSVEHAIKKMLNDPSLKKALRDAARSDGVDDGTPGAPTLPQPIDSDVEPLDPGGAPGGAIDLSI